MQKIIYASFVLAALLGCKQASADSFKAGECNFKLPVSDQWSVTNSSSSQNANINFKYQDGGKAKKANVELSCQDKNLDAALPDDFEKKGTSWEFQGGAEGSSKTVEVSGKNWHGLQTTYFQSNACILTIGSVNNGHSFRIELCDDEASLKRQIAPLNQILSSLEVN